MRLATPVLRLATLISLRTVDELNRMPGRELRVAGELR